MKILQNKTPKIPKNQKQNQKIFIWVYWKIFMDKTVEQILLKGLLFANVYTANSSSNIKKEDTTIKQMYGTEIQLI